MTLPKGVSFRPAKSCSRATARALTLDTVSRCSLLLGGRLAGERYAWFAYAGPKRRDGSRAVWLRARESDELVDFATGNLRSAAGAFGQKITLDMGGLDLKARSIEVLAERLATSPILRERLALAHGARHPRRQVHRRGHGEMQVLNVQGAAGDGQRIVTVICCSRSTVSMCVRERGRAWRSEGPAAQRWCAKRLRLEAAVRLPRDGDRAVGP